MSIWKKTNWENFYETITDGIVSNGTAADSIKNDNDILLNVFEQGNSTETKSMKSSTSEDSHIFQQTLSTPASSYKSVESVGDTVKSGNSVLLNSINQNAISNVELFGVSSSEDSSISSQTQSTPVGNYQAIEGADDIIENDNGIFLASTDQGNVTYIDIFGTPDNDWFSKWDDGSSESGTYYKFHGGEGQDVYSFHINQIGHDIICNESPVRDDVLEIYGGFWIRDAVWFERVNDNLVIHAGMNGYKEGQPDPTLTIDKWYAGDQYKLGAIMFTHHGTIEGMVDQFIQAMVALGEPGGSYTENGVTYKSWTDEQENKVFAIMEEYLMWNVT